MDESKANERVLVIPEAHFREFGYFRGFRPHSFDYFRDLLDPAQFSFRRRGEVEDDPAFKQLIPYVVLNCRDRLFHYRRGKTGTESRLRHQRSVGIGGHISDEDGPVETVVLRGMMRELQEEIDAPTMTGIPNPFGLIFDDRTPVGSVHLGIVYVANLAEPEATPRESSIADCGFSPLSQLRKERDEFESWSHFVFDALEGR